MYYYLDLFFSSLNNTYLCSVSSLILNTLSCSPLLLPHVSRFLPLSPHYSLSLLLFVSLLCSFHASFSTCFSLVYTLSSYVAFVFVWIYIYQEKGQPSSMKQMASRCEVLNQRARESFGFRVVITFEIDHLAGSSSFCTWQDRSSKLYYWLKATQWPGSTSPIFQSRPFFKNIFWIDSCKKK